jgi:uncharacterized protein (TIGR02246 family)
MIEPIEEVVAAFAAAFNAHDPAAFAAGFAEDADFTDIVGNTVLGRAAIQELHAFPFSRVLRESVLTFGRKELRRLRPDLGVAVAYWSLSGSRSRSDEVLPPRRGVVHIVCAPRADGSGRWQIVSALNSELAGIYAQQFKPGEGPPAR